MSFNQTTILLYLCLAGSFMVRADVVAQWQYNAKKQQLEKNFIRGDLNFSDGRQDKAFSVAWLQKGTVKSIKNHTVSIQRVFNAPAWFINWSNVFRLNLLDGRGKIGRHGGVMPATNTWTYIVATYDGSGNANGIKFYQDGKFVRSSPEIKGHYLAMKRLPGRYDAGRDFQGIIKSLSIYDRVLTPEEIKRNYEREIAYLPVREIRSEKFAGKKINCQIRRTAAKPVVDGNLKDSMWRYAVWKELTPVKAGIPSISTRYAFLHDDDYLYLAVKCSEPHMDRIAATDRTRDGKVWEDDSVELFIDTGLSRYYHWAVNPRGAVYDAIASKGRKHADSRWNPDIIFKTTSGKNEWNVEMAIPLSDLAFPVDHPEFLKYNLCRTRKTEKSVQQYSTSKYTDKNINFHDISRYAMGALTAGAEMPGKCDVKVNLVKMKRDKGTLVAEVILAVWAKKNNNYTLEVDGPNTGKLIVPLQMHGDAAIVKKVTLPLKEQSEHAYINLWLRDDKNSKQLCRRFAPVNLVYSPLEVKLLCPQYNHAIYSDRNIKELRFKAVVDWDKDAKYKLFFTMTDQDRKTVIQKSFGINAASGIYKVSLPDSGLRDGKYKLSFRLNDLNTKKTLGQWMSFLQKLPYRPGQVTFDQNWNCLIDGKAFFPFGGCSDYRYPKGLWDARQMGFNTVCRYGYRAMRDELDKALGKAGLKIITVPFKLGTTLPKMHQEKIKKLDQQRTKDIIDYVAKWSNSRNLLAWYTRNEAPPNQSMLEYLKSLNYAIRRGDPYHPIMGLDVHTSNISYFRDDGTTLICPDPYPAFINDGISSLKPAKPKEMVIEAIRLNNDKAAVWCMLQAFNFSYFLKHKPDWREPRFRGLRNQMYLGIIYGARGILWYEVGHGDFYPEIKYGLGFLARETAVLRHVFMAENQQNELRLLPGVKSADIHYCARKIGPDWFYFITSTGSEKYNVKFKLQAFAGDKLYVVSEQRSVRVGNKLLNDSFEPFQTHIYTTDKDIAEKLSLNKLMKKCADALKVKPCPGNLLIGADARVSWTLNINGVQSGKRGVFLTGKPVYMVDSIPFTSCSGRLGKTGYIEIVLRKTHKIAKIVLDSNINKAKIEVKKHGRWEPVADFVAASPSLVREKAAVEFTPLTVGAFRINILSLKKIFGMHNQDQQIWEIEAYE